MYLTLLFALLKLEHLLTNANPDITEHVDQRNFDRDERYDTSKPGFMMAFAIESFE